MKRLLIISGIVIGVLLLVIIAVPLFINVDSFRPDLEKPTREDVLDTFAGTHILPVPWIQPQDVSNAILYLVTEPGRYITATPR